MNRENNFFKKLSKYNEEARSLGYKWIDLIKRETRQKIINEIITQREIKIRVNKIIMENKKWLDLTKKDTGEKLKNEIKTQREIKTRVKNIIMENKKLKDLIEQKKLKDLIKQKKQKKIELNKKKMEKKKKIKTQLEIKKIVKKIISENKESNEFYQFFKIKKTKKAFNNYTSTYKIKVNYKYDPLKQLNNTKYDIIDFLKRKIKQMNGIKFNMNLQITFRKKKDFYRDDRFDNVLTELYVYKTAYFQSKPQILINDISINKIYDIAKNQILTFISKWISDGSGWVISSVDNLYINIVKYEPLKGSSYIELPIELRNSAKGLINIQNKDDKCFLYCHIRHLNPQEKYPQRFKKCDKIFINQLNYDGIDFPVNINQYNKIEKQNNININVFAYENKKPYPIYISNEKNENHIELLLLTKNNKKHYVLIKDFNKFMFNQTKNRNKKHFCMSCLQCFSSERVLNDHKNICLVINKTQAIKMPDKENNILKFNNYFKQQKVPFIIYADFEAITKKIHGCMKNDDKSFTEEYQKHIDCSYGYKLVCCYDDKYSKPVQIYRGKDSAYKFLEKMLDEVIHCKKIVKKHFNKELIMTKDDENNFKKSTECHICNKKYNEKDIRVRDHCHITGKFRGSAHQDCNLQLKIDVNKLKIPVVFHNLKNYDSHFIIQNIGKLVKNHTFKNKKGENTEMKINLIPNNMEKYMSFMIGNNLLFIDSFQFMNSSLDKLVSNLPKESFKYTSELYKDKQFDLMCKKGVYPYDFMDSFEKFNATLPSKEEFYNILNDEHITDEKYKHANSVWNTFNLKNMGQYHDLYLKTDVVLLADVFENFRNTCFEYYKLDPAHYFTSPGLSFDSMLKMTEINLELMTDIDMHLFIESGLRGGISYIAKRYSKANNKYIKDYNENLPSKYITYQDCNNLYGWAMCQYLPTGNFKWLNKNQIDKLDLTKYNETSKKGLILQVDLEYPEKLHNLHNEYPLACEKIKVNKNMLSNYCKNIANKYNISSGIVDKLIPTLNNKEKYILHYRNLQLYTELGLKITKIHRALEFDQSPWLKKYIDFNTDKRANAKNSFEKDFFKLMNNSVFGKTMENVRKRIDVRLITDEKKLLKMAAKPSYISNNIIDENLVALHKIKETIYLNRPVYIGMTILDLSKTLMYDFHYNYIKQKYGDKSHLLFTDTDSLTYEIETDDIYQDFWNDKEKFDNSDYPENSKYYDKTNKKVIGKFKDETHFVPIREFVGLKSKMYSYLTDNNKVGKTCKGIAKYVINKDITHENYLGTLFNNRQLYHKMNTIRSKNHQIHSYNINKISLSCFDDKRYILNNGINSLAYGHYKIEERL